MRWQSFVAVGDSFTEGMDDAYRTDGTYRGWADLVSDPAGWPRPGAPDFGYANLAIRGRLFPRSSAEQVPAGVAMKPDLIGFAGRRQRRAAPLASTRTRWPTRFDAVVGQAAGRWRRRDALPVRRRMAGCLASASSRPDRARKPGDRARSPSGTAAILVDLFADDGFRLNPMLWSDRPAAPVRRRAPAGRRPGADRASG